MFSEYRLSWSREGRRITVLVYIPEQVEYQATQRTRGFRPDNV